MQTADWINFGLILLLNSLTVNIRIANETRLMGIIPNDNYPNKKKERNRTRFEDSLPISIRLLMIGGGEKEDVTPNPFKLFKEYHLRFFLVNCYYVTKTGVVTLLDHKIRHSLTGVKQSTLI